MKNSITRSNSDEYIHISSLTKSVHSKPTSDDTDRRTFNVRDDSSTNDYVVSSAYQNASSAIAILDVLPLTFSIVRGFVPDPQHLANVSLPEQEPTVAQVKDLPIPIDFLPGEDDVKLKEDINFCSYDKKTIYHGELIVTKYRLLFATKLPEPIQVLVNVPIGMISQIDKIGGQTRSRSDGAFYGLEIICKDGRHFLFRNSKEQHQRRYLVDHLHRLIFPFSISQVDITNPQRFFSTFFAWNYKKAISPNEIDLGWNLYDKIKEYIRMGIQEYADPYWRIDKEVNKNYSLCDTYPDILVLPANFDSLKIPSVAKFRSKNRLPVLSWFSRETYVSITRASQPLTAFNKKNSDDFDYLQTIAKMNSYDRKLFIVDARPKVNAIVNKPQGGGYENYPECELEFQNIANIHVMRESLADLYTSIHHEYQKKKSIANDLSHLNWLGHIRAILTSINRIVSLVLNDQRSVLVHCSDGWDRTSQLTSLSMLLLDPFYRTLNGYMILIEKEWISFGHKYFLRIGHGHKIHSESSPVFLQFLDCTYQFLQQFESTFEFNETFLLTLADALYSCQYGTFLLNSEKSRSSMNASNSTMSLWTAILNEKKIYLNPTYNEQSNPILPINLSIKLWKNYYCRHIPDYQSTYNTMSNRYSTLLHLRNRLPTDLVVSHVKEDSSPQQSRTSFILSGTQTDS